MKKIFLPAIVATIYFFILGGVSAVDAAFLQFDQTSYSVNSGETFQVDVEVDAGSDQISSTDAYISYDPTLVEAQSVSAMTFFPTVTNNISSGNVYIAAFVDDPTAYKTGSAAIATVTFRALKDGSGSLTFDCQADLYNSSKIIKNDIDATNVIDCNQNIASAFTVGQVSTTNTGATIPVTKPATLPKTGIFDNVSKVAVPGMILFLIGVGLRLIL